jgi:hypothetical protein
MRVGLRFQVWDGMGLARGWKGPCICKQGLGSRSGVRDGVSMGMGGSMHVRVGLGC